MLVNPPAVPARRPLAISTDPDLLDDLSRLAAAGGVELQVAHDPTQARPGYGTAPLVLVGLDAAETCRRGRLPRRGGVVLVGRAEGPEPPWEIAQAIGAAHVAVLPSAEPWLIDRFADLTRQRTDQGGRMIGVIGGRGGAGASVLSAALAATAVRLGLRTLLIDGDPLGGGMDLVLGWEDVAGMRWPGLREARGRLQPPALVAALPKQGDLVLLSWDRGETLAVPPEAMEAAIEAARQGRDLVVIDLPRWMDDAAVAALRAVDRTLLVVPAELRATAAAARVVALVRPHCPALSLVVRGPTPGGLAAKDVAASLQLPLAGCLRPDPRLAAALERGDSAAQLARGSVAALCRRIVRDVVGSQDGEAAVA